MGEVTTELQDAITEVFGRALSARDQAVAQAYAQAGFDAAIAHFTATGELRLRPSTTTWTVEQSPDGAVTIVTKTIEDEP